MPKTTKFDSADHLRTDREIRAYLKAASKFGDLKLVKHARSVSARARARIQRSFSAPTPKRGIRKKINGYRVEIERCSVSRMYVGYVSGLSGAHSQSRTLKGLHLNMRHVTKQLASSSSSIT